MKYFRTLLLLGLTLALFSACSDDDDSGNNPQPTQNPSYTSGNVKSGAIYYSFDQEKESIQWDVKFGSYTMPGSPVAIPMFLLNDAKLGNSYVRIYNSEATALDAVTTVDAGKLGTDVQRLVQGANWFDYNPLTHQVSSKGQVYVVEASNGHMVKFRIDSFDQTQNSFALSYAHYDMSTSAWGMVMQSTVNIAAGEKLFSFAKGEVAVQPWDVKLTVLSVPTPIGPMNFPGIVLNGAAGVKAAIVNGTPFADVNAATVTPLLADGDTTYVIGTTCLNYDENSHRLSPFTDRTFVVQSTSGKRYKFRMLGYYNDQGLSGFMKFEYVKP